MFVPLPLSLSSLEVVEVVVVVVVLVVEIQKSGKPVKFADRIAVVSFEVLVVFEDSGT